MIAIILCAGYGTRLYPLTTNQPKTLLPIREKTLLDYLIEKLEKIEEINSIYIVSNNKFYINFAWWLAKNEKNFSKPVEIIDSESITLDDQKGVLNDCIKVINQKEINEYILILYGDNFFSFDLKDLINFFKKKQSSCIVCYKLKNLEDAKKFEIIEINEENKILNIEKKPQESKSNLSVTGIYIIRKEDLPKLKQFYEISKKQGKLNPNFDIFSFFIDLYKKQNIFTFSFSGEWLILTLKRTMKRF